jgi:hypothetical protein
MRSKRSLPSSKNGKKYTENENLRVDSSQRLQIWRFSRKPESAPPEREPQRLLDLLETTRDLRFSSLLRNDVSISESLSVTPVHQEVHKFVPKKKWDSEKLPREIISLKKKSV